MSKLNNSKLTKEQLEDLANKAETFADKARVKSLEWFRTPLEVLTKLDDSPVTIADREVESVLRDCIISEYPEHGIWGEEHGATRMQSSHVWVVDPIDGTRSFISGSPLWGTLISLLVDGTPSLGIIDIPFTKERWVGKLGKKTKYQGTEVSTSNCEDLKDAVLLCTTPDIFKPEELEKFNKVSNNVQMRRFGGDCYAYGLLVSGYADIVIESELQPYDFMALVPIIEGAGGCITDWQGNALSLDSGCQVIASANPKLHAQVLELLNS